MHVLSIIVSSPWWHWLAMSFGSSWTFSLLSWLHALFSSAMVIVLGYLFTWPITVYCLILAMLNQDTISTSVSQSDHLIQIVDKKFTYLMTNNAYPDQDLHCLQRSLSGAFLGSAGD